MTNELHVLVVTADGDDEFDCDYTIECPGVTDACQMWRECEHPTCRPWAPDNRDGYVDHAAWDDAMWDNHNDWHGVEHQSFSFGWAIPADGECFVRDNDHLPEAAQWLTEKHSLGPGRYAVKFRVEDEEDLELALTKEANHRG